jgi:hypothetical protein
MSDENLWGDDDSFVDMPDEAKLDSNGRALQSPPVQLPRPKAPVAATKPSPEIEKQTVSYEEYSEQFETEEIIEEEDFSDVLTDAHLRLEQGSLYKMIMNHNLFEGLDADPKAIQNVQKEIRGFVKERMEVMLGMRKETATVEHLEINFPFNALEVTTLKALARTATKGATDHSDNFVPEVKRVTEELDTVPKKRTLNPLSGSTAPKKAVSQVKKPLPAKPTAPLKRTRLDLTIDQIAAEEGIPRELLEENVPGLGGKSPSEMTESEILERNKMIAKRRTSQVKSNSALPMATPEQQEMLAISRANQVSTSTPLMAKI